MSNAAAARPGVKVQLDKERTLVLDLNAFCKLEEYLETTTGNRNVFTSINWLQMNLREFTLVLWAALQTNHPELSLDDVRRIVPFSKFPELRPVIDSLLEQAIPPTEPLPEGYEAIDEEKKTETAPQIG